MADGRSKRPAGGCLKISSHTNATGAQQRDVPGEATSRGASSLAEGGTIGASAEPHNEGIGHLPGAGVNAEGGAAPVVRPAPPKGVVADGHKTHPVFRPRSAQIEFERGVELHRVCGLLARRQFGKTTGVSRIALKKMMKKPGHDVVFGSVKLDLGREIVRKEAAALRAAIGAMQAEAAAARNLLKLADSATGRELPSDFADPRRVDDFDDVYEASRLEFRLYHSNTVYSRTKVVALTPDAVGETGDLILDEVGRVKKFREVWEAVKPIISSNPMFRCLLTTTPPPDDSHFSFELLASPIDMVFKPNRRGNWYKSEHGVHVLRVDAWDAYADGVPMYDDDSGKAITPEQSRAQDIDKEAWDRNYGIKFIFGGTAACGFLELDTAQRKGMGRARCFLLSDDNDAEFDAGLTWLIEQLGPGPVGLGWDLATTENETSNPNGFTVMQQCGDEFVEVAVFVWKTKDPRIAKMRAREIVGAVAARKAGGRARRLCVDATNERYFATELRNELGAVIPVELVIGSETIEVPAHEEPITMKQYLGGQYVAVLNDNHLTLPPERYIKEDHRLPKTEKGKFVCVPDAQGRHGDTFDGGKLALRALRSNAGAIRTPAGIHHGGGESTESTSRIFIPRGWQR